MTPLAAQAGRPSYSGAASSWALPQQAPRSGGRLASAVRLGLGSNSDTEGTV